MIFIGAILLAAAVISACRPGRGDLRFRAVYIDLDGTTLTPDGLLLPETIRCVRAYQACGGRLGIATGRTLTSAQAVVDSLRPTLPVVCYNGGLVIDRAGTVLHMTILPRELIPNDSLRRLLLSPSLTAVASYVKDGMFLHVAQRDIRLWLQHDPNPILGFRASTDSLFPAILQQPVLKLVFLVPAESLEVFGARLQSIAIPGVRMTRSSPTTIELLPMAANKAHAIGVALKGTGLALNDLLVFGDSDNDLEMLSEAGASIAMANGTEKARRTAVATIDSNSTPSLARALRAFALTANCPCAAATYPGRSAR